MRHHRQINLEVTCSSVVSLSNDRKVFAFRHVSDFALFIGGKKLDVIGEGATIEEELQFERNV